MPQPQLEPLASRLEAAMGALSRRCIDAMYADPFWHARFGDRGRRHAEDDSAYHVRYVVAALRADSPGVFEHYALWLRGVLASRGMCSWHLAESFRQLTRALVDEAIHDAEPAAALLASGTRALAYADGDAGAIERKMDALVARVRGDVGGDAYRLDELLSFVRDDVARDADGTRAHVAFVRDVLARGVDRDRLARTLDAVTRAALTELRAPVADRVRALVGPPG